MFDLGVTAGQQCHPQVAVLHIDASCIYIASPVLRLVCCSTGLYGWNACLRGRWYGPELATFEESCRRLMGTFNTLLPEGSLKVRVRCTSRESKHLKESSLGETLGDEATGMVQLFRT